MAKRSKKSKKKFALKAGSWRVILDHEYVYLERHGVAGHFTFPTQLLRRGPDAGTSRPHMTQRVRGKKRSAALDASTMALVPVSRAPRAEWPGVVKLRRADFDRFIEVMQDVLAQTLLVGLRVIDEQELVETFPLVLTPDAAWYEQLLKRAISESDNRLTLSLDAVAEVAADLNLDDVLHTSVEAIEIVREAYAATGNDSVMLSGFMLPKGVTEEAIECLDDMESYQLIWRRLPDGRERWMVFMEPALDRDAMRKKMLDALGPKPFRALNNVLAAFGMEDAIDLEDLKG